MNKMLWMLGLVCALLWACEEQAPGGAAGGAKATAEKAAPEADKTAPETTVKPAEPVHEGEHGHEGEAHAALAPQPEAQGPLDVALGAALGAAERVDVLDLSKNAATYEGKTVRIEGAVTDMCFHRRGWFGVASADGTRMVRVITTPTFQVPEGAVGASAVAEGVVEVMTIPAADVPHYRESHKFIADDEIGVDGTIKQAVVRATGASFKR